MRYALRHILILITAIGCPLTCGIQLCACLSGLCSNPTAECCSTVNVGSVNDGLLADDCCCGSSSCGVAQTQNTRHNTPLNTQQTSENAFSSCCFGETEAAAPCCSTGCAACECCSDIPQVPFDSQRNHSTDVELSIAWAVTCPSLADPFPKMEYGVAPDATRQNHAMDDRSWLCVWLN